MAEPHSELVAKVRAALPRPTQDPRGPMGRWVWSEPTQREIEAGKAALDEIVEEHGRLVEQLETALSGASRSEKYAEERDQVAQEFEENLALLQQAVQNYIDADSRYQRRIDTSELLDALESTSNPATITGDGSGEVLPPLVEGYSAERTSNPATKVDAMGPGDWNVTPPAPDPARNPDA